MKNLRYLSVTLILTLVLTNAAFAGDGIIWTGYAPPPPPPSTPSRTGVIDPALIASGEELKSEKQTTVDLATEIALSLVQSMLALF